LGHPIPHLAFLPAHFISAFPFAARILQSIQLECVVVGGKIFVDILVGGIYILVLGTLILEYIPALLNCFSVVLSVSGS
jgi:hypothetical protein